MSPAKAAALLAVASALALASCGGDEEGQTASRDQGAAQTRDAEPRDAEGAERGGAGSKPSRPPGGDNSIQQYGSEQTGAELEQAAAALHGFLDARARRAWAAACEHLAADLARSLEEAARRSGAAGATCGAGLKELTIPAAIPQFREEARQADVRSLRAEGDRGFLLYRTGEGSFAVAVAGEDDGWRVAGLSALQLS